ncbi:uncharacterized protein LOC121872641 [Homarus americanus]|uniref:Uncharacterized protein n=1 Tax=Homarus americanus TaxID=6706 RepID=A0A8J5MTE4_HOMAM|nr:uncharacterized protein LOC121872641 [Homarus americanus]KAG7163610.1 hypothetical protein Hamer_G002826 [Homarus americanus]
MKRFWLEEVWRWSRNTKMTTGPMNLYTTLTLLVLIQLVPSTFAVEEYKPSTFAVGQKCNLTALQPCSSNEMCVEVSEGNGICQCKTQFILNEATGKCEENNSPVEPSNSHLGLGIGLGIMIFLLLAVVVVTLVHCKFGLFPGMCDHLPPLRLFGRRGQDISMVNNEDDDVNPIV